MLHTLGSIRVVGPLAAAASTYKAPSSDGLSSDRLSSKEEEEVVDKEGALKEFRGKFKDFKDSNNKEEVRGKDKGNGEVVVISSSKDEESSSSSKEEGKDKL